MENDAGRVVHTTTRSVEAWEAKGYRVVGSDAPEAPKPTKRRGRPRKVKAAAEAPVVEVVPEPAPEPEPVEGDGE